MRLYRLTAILIMCGLAAGLIFGLGCSKDDSPSGTANALVFPMKIGNIWEYSRMFYTTNFEPDSLAQYYADTVFAQSATYILRKDTLSDTLETYVFKTIWLESPHGNELEEYFNNTSDGMYAYAYSSPDWIGPPKKVLPKGIHFEFKGLRFQTLDELVSTVYAKMSIIPSKSADSIIFEEPPIRELMYPITIGQRWIYRSTDRGDVWNMEKEIMDRETIEVPADSFFCYQIQWFWDTEPDGVWNTDIEGYDYFCEAGIVKRVFIIHGIQIIDEFGQFLGSFDDVDIYELTGYSLK